MNAFRKYFVGLGVAGFLFPILFVITLPVTLYTAWCDKLLWNWFVAGYLHLQPLTVWLAFAIVFALRSIFGDYRVVKGREYDYGKGILTGISAHTFALILGFVLHRWFV